MSVRAIDDTNFGQVYADKIGPEQLQSFHTGYRLSGMSGEDAPYGYQKHLGRKTVYLPYEYHGASAEIHLQVSE
jgi:lactaldehyde dehydrogenase / glycolaldehyde dehydrogenase